MQVLEADTTLGGRARSALYQGEPVDRGFQTVFRGYAETRSFLDAIGLTGEHLRPFERGVVVHDGNRWRRVRASPAGAIHGTGVGVSDLRKVVGFGVRILATPVARLLEERGDTTASDLVDELGVSEELGAGVLRPLLGGMLLDRSLSADAGYARFLIAMMGRGPAMLPVDGMGMIAQRAEAAIAAAGGMIWTGVRVAQLDLGPDGTARGVLLADGRAVAARTIVVALDARNSRELLAEADPASAARLPTEAAGAISAAFALEQPLYAGRTLLLDGASPDRDNRVDLLCQTTNVTRPGSPGPHIVIAQSATRNWTQVDPERYVAAVAENLARWAPRFPWKRLATPIDTFRNDWAQFVPRPGVRRDLPGPRTAITNVILAGDAVMHPSIEGAVVAGHRAARIVHGILR